MANEIPMTIAENHAERASKLPAFGINLSKLRSTISLILSEWKSSGIFQEYTYHSFGHVIDMLKTAEWLIPIETQEVMSPADWMMLTLSSYFHDIGLLVTKAEFENRTHNPEFRAFLNNPVLPAEKHSEFMARMDELDLAERDRLLYQEFVRSTHGKRVRRWIEGLPLDDAGASTVTGAAINELLAPLDDDFRRDLAIICESHTLNHADILEKLSVSQPYGSRDETCNLIYIAVILRSIDLLQITNRRAPTVLYQILQPSNPVSQLEWQKQNSVKTIRAAEPRDRDGNVTSEGSSSTIEVFATLKEPQSFFGLTTYLSYVQKELTLSYNAVLKAKQRTSKPYLFPWRDLDTTGVKAIGFMTESFEFALDQHKILDLLTGHTLYNNTRVVLRELTQNALDAVRLQSDIENRPSSESQGVEIRWNSADRSLTVLDYGTGMTQEVIENHLLTVGSSRYQDKQFVEKYPSFHSISRFGIGVLSAFMVSDDVEITTCSPEQEPARRIALQSVHGKYLIKLLDKVVDRSDLPMFPHGTMVKLKLRPLAQIGDVLEVARSWVMFPRCPVIVKIDDNEPIKIGYDSPAQAVEAFLSPLRKRNPRIDYKVEQFSDDGVDIAFALSKSNLFKDWSFVNANAGRIPGDPDAVLTAFATCIEGVAVQPTSPGFDGGSIVAVANATGKDAPKTNVARSALEDTKEHRAMLASIYNMYAKHVTNEIANLAGSDEYSLSRAVGLAPFIASPLIHPSNVPTKRDLLHEAMGTIPFVLIEHGADRKSISFNQLSIFQRFQTIDSPLYRSIEFFVKEAPADITAEKLLDVLGNRSTRQGKDPIICNMGSGYIEDRIRDQFEVTVVEASVLARNITLTWEKKSANGRWLTGAKAYEASIRADPLFYSRLSEARDRNRNATRHETDRSLNVPLNGVTANGLDGYGSFIANRERFLVPSSPLATYLANVLSDDNDIAMQKTASHLILLDAIRSSGWTWDIMNPELTERLFATGNMNYFRQYIADVKGFVMAINQTSSQTFDSYAWDRRGGFDVGYF